MSSIHSQSNLTNPHNINVWRKISGQAVRNNPNDQAALFVHCALNMLYETYVENLSSGANPLDVRKDIFKYFQQAAISGSPAAKDAGFYEGLARLEGFGCTKDQITGKALIQVAAVARGSKPAINFVQMRLGVAHLFGKGAPQSFKDAIQNFKAAGEIAQPHLGLVAEHLQRMRVRLLSQVIPAARNVVVQLESQSLPVAKLRMV